MIRERQRQIVRGHLAAFCASPKKREIGLREGGISRERNERSSVSMKGNTRREGERTERGGRGRETERD